MKISGEPQPCAIANLTGAHGTVVLDIIIAKTGAVEDVKSVSGPPLLHNCAVTAVKTFRYQPQPVRIHTQVVLVYQTTAAPQSK
jgi:TonB family protein